MTTFHPPQSLSGRMPVLGPADRVHFADEQTRRRRQTWRYTALCALAAALVGIPLATFVTAFVYFFGILVLKFLSGYVPVPAEVWSTLRELALVVPDFLDGFSESTSDSVLESLRAGLANTTFPFDSPAFTVAALLLPSMATVVVLWLLYRSLFTRVGVGSELLALGAREPRLDDLEERQLVNLVEEMALAATLPPPRVRLIDTPGVNAAAVGSTIDDAVIVVTRGTLDHLERAETQAIIAHLIASVGNGDMRIALSITTLFQAIEMFFTVFDALFNLSWSAWRELFQLVKVIARGGRDPRSAAALAHLMEHRLGEMREDGIFGVLQDASNERPKTLRGKIVRKLPLLYVVAFPFLFMYIFVLLLKAQVWMYRYAVVGPLVMLVWRSRRYLADATAVQLTRQPDALSNALRHLAQHGALVPGGQWFAHLFIVGSEVARSNPGAKSTWSTELAGIASHPAIAKRLNRLRALGAGTQQAQPAPVKVRRRRWRIRDVVGSSLAMTLVLLLPAIAALMLFVMVAVFLFGAASATFFLGFAMLIITELLL